MTLINAINLFESLKAKTVKKSEIKVYTQFIDILKKLENREFTSDEIQSIELELDSLKLKSNPENRKKFYKKVLTQFETYLKDTFSLISKGYYTKFYGGLGLSIGLLFGVVFLSNWERSLGISLGLIIGMVIGASIGQAMDTKAKGESRVL